MLIETQAWTLRPRTGFHLLDLTWKLQARIDLRFGKYAYGGLFIRMPHQPNMPTSFETSTGVVVRTQADAQRANWVALALPLGNDSQFAGMAIMDHPSNPEYPTPWRVDGYYGIGPARCIAGEWHLPAGQCSVFNYRLVLFDGKVASEFLNSEFTTFSSERVSPC
jgi:hypothetical protein